MATPTNNQDQPSKSIWSSLSELPRLAWNGSVLFTQPRETLNLLFPNASSPIKFNPETDIEDLSGKVILVTGGNSGLGKETVLQLAKHRPHKIFLAARNESKAKAAIEDITTTIGGGSSNSSNNNNNKIRDNVDIEWLPLDLASLASVKAAAETVKAKTDRLDILILNAGIMAVPPGKTDSGFDIQLGTNYVGHFLLTKLLLPLLQKTAGVDAGVDAGADAGAGAGAGAGAATHGGDVRVVIVSSAAHVLGPTSMDGIIDTDKLTASSPWVRYGASKTADLLFAAELARRYPGLTSTSLHPGIILTNLFEPLRNQLQCSSFSSFSPFSWVLNTLGPWVATDVRNGSLNQLYLATTTQKERLTNGGYYLPVGRLQADNKWAKDASAAQRLWDWTEAELEKVGY